MGEQKRRRELHFITTRTNNKACLNCGRVLDAATTMFHDKAPFPGAISICFLCGHIMALDENLEFRELNDEEILGIAGNEEILQIQAAMAASKAEVAIADEVNDIIEKKVKECHPVIACIVNAINPDVMPSMIYHAKDDSMPGHSGYGATPREALKALIQSYAKEIIKDAT